MKAMPRGTSMRPSMPERKKRGAKLATMMSVELSMGMRTSLDALKMTSMSFLRIWEGWLLFSLMRLYTFSTSTMASSTSDPIAMQSPPRLMVLMVRPRRCSTSMEVSRAMGMVTSEMTVVLTLARKRKSMTTTKMAPSMRACRTLLTLLSMKRDWRYTSECISMSLGSWWLSSSRARSIFSVRSMVEILGCLVTVSTTDGWAL